MVYCDPVLAEALCLPVELQNVSVCSRVCFPLWFGSEKSVLSLVQHLDLNQGLEYKEQEYQSLVKV